MPISRIVTDNDGVNIDSEDLAMRIMDDEGVALIKRYNPDEAAKLAPDYIYTTYPGTSTDKIVRQLIEKHDLPLAIIAQDNNMDGATIDEVATHLADLITIATIDRFRGELKTIPGTTEAWAALGQRFGADSLALATTSRADRMDVSLEHAVDPVTGKNAGLGQVFPRGQRRFSGYGNKNKYNAFFAQSGWDPAQCAIVEDSLSGVRYAKEGRAGTKVIGTVAAKFYKDKSAHAAALLATGADLVVSTMHDLPAAVQWLNDGLRAERKPDFTAQVFQPQPAMAATALRPNF